MPALKNAHRNWHLMTYDNRKGHKMINNETVKTTTTNKETVETRSVILVATDGYSINVTKFKDVASAKTAMTTAYNESNHNENGDDWDTQSELGDMNAILYDRGENVFVWSIVEV